MDSRKAAIVFLLILSCLLPAARRKPATQAVPQEPLLRIETGMHTAVITAMALNGSGRFLVTASDDKTARVWDAQTGDLLVTLRPPVAQGYEGKLNAVAVSSDGALVAVSGITGASWDQATSIYVLERATGRLLRRLAAGREEVLALAFSPDGRYLAAGCGGREGLRIFRTSDWGLAQHDGRYNDDCRGVAFAQNGSLAAVGWDRIVRLYNSSLRIVERARMRDGLRPTSCAFSPDGQMLAVGYDDTLSVDVLSGRNLSQLYQPNTGLPERTSGTNLAHVVWSQDGQTLYAAGSYTLGGVAAVVAWDNTGRGAPHILTTVARAITCLVPLPRNRLAYASAAPAWGVLDSTGRRTLIREGVAAAFAGQFDTLRVSPDGSRVSFALDKSGRQATFSLTDRQLRSGQTPDADMLEPLLQHDSSKLRLVGWQGSESPLLNGRREVPLRLDQQDESRSAAIAPDGQHVVIGTSENLYCFDVAGRRQWKAALPAAAEVLNVAGRADLCVAALGDGTLRWYSMADGKQLLAMFPHKDGRRWVAWTPAGYYDCSPGGQDLAGWHLNHGKDSAADFFPLSRFRDTFYKPVLLASALSSPLAPPAPVLAQADMPTQAAPAALAMRLPPVVTILSPGHGETFVTNAVSLSVSLRTATDAPVTSLRALVDGRPAAAVRGVSIKDPQSRKQAPSGEDMRTISVPVPGRDVEIAVLAENAHGASAPAVLKLRWAGKAPSGPQGFSIQPKLYVLAVGVSDYSDDALDLGFAAKDAGDFVRALQTQKGRLYRGVDVRLLTDKKVTRDSLLDGLEWLERNVTQHDVGALFLAGHGVNDTDGDYYFLPSDARLDNLRRTGLPFGEIKKTVANLTGKSLFFVDTCHSGNVMGGRRGVSDVGAVINELTSAENGAVVFASATGRQYALENRSWGNGAFTKALVEGLTGKADYQKTGRITVNMLDLYISERVKQLTGGKQTPTTTKPATVPDFPVAVVR